MNYTLNYTRAKDADTIEWNKKLNREDIIHDSPGLNNRDKSKQNPLFRNCLDTFAPPSTGKADYIESDYVCVLPFKESKGIKPVQLSHISESIPDTYPGEKIGLPDRISPSYYFDPASRKYTEKVKIGGRAVIKYKLDTLKAFLTAKNSSEITEMQMKDYGISDLSFKASITGDSKLTFEFSSTNPYVDSFTIKVDREGFAEYAGTPTYIAGNAEKKKYFDDNKSPITAAKMKDGTRYILCKLLGDLSHVLYSDDTTIVFTNDTYLRDRCIKNKTATVCREFLGKNYMTGGVVERKSRKPVAKKTKAVKQSVSKNPKKEPVKKVNMANKTSVYKLYDISRPGIMRGGAAMVMNSELNSETNENIDSDYFANKSNINNLLSEIDIYISRIDQFLAAPTFKIGSDEVRAYLTSLKKFLSETVKAEINKLDINKPVKEFNNDIMQWFPLQVIFYSEDMSTKVHPSNEEQTGYYSPKNIAKVFPKLGDEIQGFQNKIPNGSFKNFVSQQAQTSAAMSGSLSEILPFLENEFSELSASEELTSANQLLDASKADKNLSESANFINLIDAAVDFGVIDEYDVLIEYLRDICNYDDVYANTCYTILRPMVYFNGYNIYDYDILKAFVDKIKGDVPEYKDDYSSFDAFLMQNMKDDEELVDEDYESDEEMGELATVKPENVFDFRNLEPEPEKAFVGWSVRPIGVFGGSRKTLKKRRTKRAKKGSKGSKRRTRKH